MSFECFLAPFSEVPCEGPLVRAHLIRAQTIRRRVGREHEMDGRAWVWACGGWGHGNEGHHGMLDSPFGAIVLERSDLPAAVEEFAAEHDLAWWLDRRYGPLIPDSIPAWMSA